MATSYVRYGRYEGPMRAELSGGRVQRKCVIVAHAVHESGRREIVGLDVSAVETERS